MLVILMRRNPPVSAAIKPFIGKRVSAFFATAIPKPARRVELCKICLEIIKRDTGYGVFTPWDGGVQCVSLFRFSSSIQLIFLCIPGSSQTSPSLAAFVWGFPADHRAPAGSAHIAFVCF